MLTKYTWFTVYVGVIVEYPSSFTILLLSDSDVILSFHLLGDCPKMLKLMAKLKLTGKNTAKIKHN